MLKTLSLIINTFCFSLFGYAQNAKTDSLLEVLKNTPDDTGKVTLFANIIGTLRFTDPLKAISFGQKGILLSKKLGFDKGSAACFLNLSTAYIYADNLDTALLYLDTALQYAHKVGNPNRLGLAYLNRADIYRQMQNFSQSLKDCETALKYADEANNDDVRARINQTIGAVYYQQNLYQPGIIYYEKAIGLYKKTGNQRMCATVLNNLGLIYKSTGAFDKAIIVTNDAIRITDSLKDITNLSVFVGNLSDIYYQKGNYPEAEKYAGIAFEYAQKQQNEKQMAIARAFMGNTYIRQKRFAEAIDVSEKAMDIFKKEEDVDRINSTADMLAEAYAGSGNFAKAYEYIVVSKTANDTLMKWRYDDDIAAMQTKFKVNEKDKEILLLAKDKELQQQKLQRRSLLLITIIALALLAIGGFWLLMNKRKLQEKMKELELRNNIAADLHDEVGSSLSSIHMLSEMAAIQPQNDPKHQDILSRMSNNAKETMEKMSDIVWMIKPGENEGYSLLQRMEKFAYDICYSKNIETILNLDELENIKLTMDQRKNIYLIFKEAINNAVKYSAAQKITCSCSYLNKQLSFVITDNGKGFDVDKASGGNGLNNIRQRAIELKGNVKIDSEINYGTTVTFILPV